jgi:hypothetical protein
MLINICKLNKSSELKSVEIGAQLVGLKIYSMVIETGEEAYKLSQERGQKWLKDNCSRFVPNKI